MNNYFNFLVVLFCISLVVGCSEHEGHKRDASSSSYSLNSSFDDTDVVVVDGINVIWVNYKLDENTDWKRIAVANTTSAINAVTPDKVAGRDFLGWDITQAENGETIAIAKFDYTQVLPRITATSGMRLLGRELSVNRLPISLVSVQNVYDALILPESVSVSVYSVNGIEKTASDQLAEGDYLLISPSTSLTRRIELKGVAPRVAGGYRHTNALDSSGQIWGWGREVYASLSTSRYDNTSTPSSIVCETSCPAYWVDLSVGYEHSLAIDNLGRLWSWGENDDYSLGQSYFTYSSIADLVPVSNTVGWSVVEAGLHRSYAIKKDGSLYAWGRGYGYALGSNSTSHISRPQRIGSSNDWIDVVAYGERALGLKKDGSLWAWGENTDCSLGIKDCDESSSSAYVTTPQALNQGKDWASLSASAVSEHVLGIKVDGSLWSWGANNLTATGSTATEGTTRTPTRIGDSRAWAQAVAGYRYSLALDEAGNAFVWGSNQDGQLGVGHYTDVQYSSSLPKVEGYYLNVKYPWMSLSTAVFADYNRSNGVLENGVVLGWGEDYDYAGEALGISNTNAPQPILLLNGNPLNL
ncbi:RCC1 domain-containing protein [Marinospirillum perlucidum]|uniref:RCC1 domain-containing protein n=1 Tax=Marinospirillum perlucidum TaxID=1982602 RepID=UPI00138FFEBA|nr:hypothetical protein [Marinospirillum perlucidum]